MNRLINNIQIEVLKKLYIKIIPSFPVAPSGKRDIKPLLVGDIFNNIISNMITFYYISKI